MFFTASQIVADDKTRIVEEQLKKISALNEQAEKARAAAVTAQQESERARARIEESEKRANIIQGRMEATKVEAEKAVEELRRSLASMKK